MLAQNGPVALDGEELVLQVLPDRVHPGKPEEVVQVDEVLHGHGEDAGEGHPHHMRDAVPAADGNHETVVVGAEGLLLLLPDIRRDVVRRRLSGLEGGFHDLGNHLLVLHEPDHVAAEIDVPVVHRLHLLVHQDPAPLSHHVPLFLVKVTAGHAVDTLHGGDRALVLGALALGQGDLRGELRALNARGPDERVRPDLRTVREFHHAFARADNGGVQQHLDALLLHVSPGLPLRLLGEHWKDAVLHLDDRDVHLVGVDVVLGAELVAPFHQFAGELNAGEPRARNGKCETLFALFRVRLLGRVTEPLLDVGADPDGVLQRPEGEGVLLHPRNAEELRPTAGPDDQVVVLVSGRVRDHDVVVKVDRLDLVNHHIDGGPRKDLPETDLHRFRFRAGPGNLMQLRHEGVVGVAINKRYLYVWVSLEVLVEVLRRFNAAVPATEDCDSGLRRHTCSRA